jgi:toxin ParE1/3/4
VSGKPVLPRERANRDVEEAVDHYVREASPTVALGFIDAFDRYRYRRS